MTTDRESLLRAVLAAPGDDLPRLVLADCLAEDPTPGNEQLEQTIRWDHPLTFSLTTNGWVFTDGEPASTMVVSGCLNVLWELGADGWDLGMEVVFRRGFVSELRGPLAAFWGERECDWCDGTGGGASDMSGEPCPKCRGTGRIPGPTDALISIVREHPVELLIYSSPALQWENVEIDPITWLGQIPTSAEILFRAREAAGVPQPHIENPK